MGIEFNFDELENALSDLSKKISNDISEKALLKGANVTLESQQKNVPKGKTGNLKRSLGVFEPKGNASNKKVEIGIKHNKDRSVTYGYYQEYGTANMIGKKWMKIAWQKSKDETLKEISESLAEDLCK